MNVKKCATLLLSAVFAVLTLAGCGRSDYSALAAKTLNEAQGNRPAVTFETHQKLTSALWAALEEAAQLSDIQQAMTRNNGMQELLTGRYSLEIYTVSGSLRPQDDAAKIAQEILDTLSGRREEGFISMVKSDGSYYAAVLTWRSSSGSGSDDSGNSGATDPDEPAQATYPVQWDESTKTLTFREGAFAAMGGTSILDEQSTLDGLNAEQGKAEGKTFNSSNFSLMNVVHLVVEENSGVTEIEDGIGGGPLPTIKIGAFALSEKLETVELHGVERIGDGAFYSCKRLKEITISGGDNLVIDEWAFSIPINTTNVYEVDIHAQSSIILENRAFSNTFAAKDADQKADFSAPEICIENQVFFPCDGAVEITFAGKVTAVGDSAFRTAYITSYNEKLKIRYTGDSVDEFEKACGGELSKAGLHEDNFVE